MDLDKIILNVLNNKASKEEYEILEAWKKESSDNIAFLNEMKERASVGGYKEYDVKKAWDKVDTQLTENTPKSSSKLWLIGALILMVGAAVFYFSQRTAGPNIFDSGDEVQQIATTDNSSIWLNENTHLAEVSDFTQTREVDLKGEAFFDVVSDKEKPFVIHINDTEFIKVLGTSFNVLNRSDNFDIAVYTGHVQLHVLGGRVIDLYKNDRVKKVNGSYVKVNKIEQNILSWKTNTLIFDNTPLSDVLTKLEDHYKVNFNHGQVDLSSCNLRSKFQNETFDTVLSELESHFNLEYSKDQNNINITGIKCD